LNVMRKTYYLIIILLILISCAGKNTYDLRFKSEGGFFDGYRVFVYSLTDNGATSDLVDSAVISKGQFFLSGTSDSADWFMLVVNNPTNEQNLSRLFYPEKHLSVSIEGDQIKVTGGKVNDAFQKFVDGYNALTIEAIGINNKLMADPQNEELQKQLAVAYQKFESAFRLFALKSIKENLDNPASIIMLKSSASMLEDADIESIITKADTDFLKDPFVEELTKQLKQSKKVAIGSPYIDIAMMSPTGDTVTLSNYIESGHYVLIDFWASWCGPCLRELPNVLDCYKRYHAKGFDVVGVSLDEKSEEWKAAVKTYSIPWPQLSDLAGWNSIAVSLYAFSSIPHTVLIDPDGVIVQKDLRGEALKAKLAELFD
jgi:peroxiredoxin